MTNKCEISIIIPAYNAQEYIMKCLNSIKVQTFKNYEIIIIDDGSIDQTTQYIEKFIMENPDIECKFIRKSNNFGHTFSRNLGIQMARGSYICTIDADDSCHPDFLLLLYHKLKENYAEFVFCGYDRVKGNKIIPYKSKWSYPNHNNITKLKFAYLISKTHICHCTVLYDKTFIQKNNLHYTTGCRVAGDTEFITKVLFNNPRFACVPQTLYYYNIHDNSISTSSPSEIKFDGYYAYERAREYIKNPLWKFLFFATRESREVYSIIETFYCQDIDLPYLFCSKYKILLLLIINALRKYKRDKESAKILLQFYKRYFKKV